MGADHPQVRWERWSVRVQHKSLCHPVAGACSSRGGHGAAAVSSCPGEGAFTHRPPPRHTPPVGKQAGSPVTQPLPCLASPPGFSGRAPQGPRWRKPDRNQAPCASAPDQVLPAPRPLRRAERGAGRPAASPPLQDRGLATLTERLRAQSPPHPRGNCGALPNTFLFASSPSVK